MKTNYSRSNSRSFSVVGTVIDIIKFYALVLGLCWLLSAFPASELLAAENLVGACPNGTIYVQCVNGPFNYAYWSVNGGQDDLLWESAENGSFIPNYREEGIYIIHVYTKNSMEWVGACYYDTRGEFPAPEELTAAPEKVPCLTAGLDQGNLVIDGFNFPPSVTLEIGEITPGGQSEPVVGLKTDATGAFKVAVAQGDKILPSSTYQVKVVNGSATEVVGHVAVSGYFAESAPAVLTEVQGKILVSGIPSWVDSVQVSPNIGGQWGQVIVLSKNSNGAFVGEIPETINNSDLVLLQFDVIDVSDGPEEVKASSCAVLGELKFAFAETLGDPSPGYCVTAVPQTDGTVLTVQQGQGISFTVTRVDQVAGEIPVFRGVSDADGKVSVVLPTPVPSFATTTYKVYRSTGTSEEFIGTALLSNQNGSATAAVLYGGSVTVTGADAGRSWVDLIARDADSQMVEKVHLSRTGESTFHTWYIPGEDVSTLSLELGTSTPDDPQTGLAGAVVLFNIGQVSLA